MPPLQPGSGAGVRIDRPITRLVDVKDAAPAKPSVEAKVVLSPTDDPRLALMGLAGQAVLALSVPREPAGSTYDRLTKADLDRNLG